MWAEPQFGSGSGVSEAEHEVGVRLARALGAKFDDLSLIPKTHTMVPTVPHTQTEIHKIGSSDRLESDRQTKPTPRSERSITGDHFPPGLGTEPHSKVSFTHELHPQPRDPYS